MSLPERSVVEMNPLSAEIVDCAFQVHKHFGPGLLENIYHEAFLIELQNRQISYKSEKSFPLEYKGKILKSGFKADIIVNNEIIIELKAVEKILPVHQAQILSYLKLTNKQLGFLINFNVPLIKDGINRYVI